MEYKKCRAFKLNEQGNSDGVELHALLVGVTPCFRSFLFDFSSSFSLGKSIKELFHQWRCILFYIQRLCSQSSKQSVMML